MRDRLRATFKVKVSNTIRGRVSGRSSVGIGLLTYFNLPSPAIPLSIRGNYLDNLLLERHTSTMPSKVSVAAGSVDLSSSHMDAVSMR